LYALLFVCFGVVFLHLNVHRSCQNFHFFQRRWATKKQRKQRQIHRYTAQTGRYTARTDWCTDPNRLYRCLVLIFWICAVLSGIPPVPLGIPLSRVGGTPPRIGRANPAVGGLEISFLLSDNNPGFLITNYSHCCTPAIVIHEIQTHLQWEGKAHNFLQLLSWAW
jgi:hypothetical protein